MRSSALTIIPILALAALASAGPLTTPADFSVSPPMPDIDTDAAPDLMKRGLWKRIKGVGKDAVYDADSVYAPNRKREEKAREFDVTDLEGLRTG